MPDEIVAPGFWLPLGSLILAATADVRPAWWLARGVILAHLTWLAAVPARALGIPS